MYEEILTIIAGLAGLGGFISILVNILKLIGIVKDGTSGTWFQTLNLIVFVVVGVIYILQVQMDWSQIDEWLKMLTLFAGFIIQIFTGQQTYKLTKGAPLVGFRYSDKN